MDEMLITAVAALLLAVIIGGTILLLPVSRKLGQLMEAHIREKQRVAGSEAGRMEHLAGRMARLEKQVRAVAERQEFLDRLLLEENPSTEPASPEPPPGGAEAARRP